MVTQKTVRPMLSDYCLSCPVCDVGVLWPKGWMDHDATWYGGSPRLKLHCLRCGLSYLPTERGTAAQQPPPFGPCLLWRYTLSNTSVQYSSPTLSAKTRLKQDSYKEGKAWAN